ncbi:hypothetical protein [Chryseobacterium sp. WLY505]|uniref:hypothetical protein n=1 Tax=Chryseobacterium sp. WLY505 TaxID=3068892 RepID=UPI0027968BDC|nr:hypothetical protein [Chryseobacterium sp. WLY505]MDQ1855781.1 hypothetical protein [Chryseobacterium sp. WLY505]
MIKTLIPLFVLCAISCEKSKINPSTKDDPYIDSLMTEIKANEKVQFDEINHKLKEHSKAQSQYLFVRLAITENQINQIREANIVSPIQELDHFNDEIKARIEDQVVGEYLNSPSTAVYHGSITKKETFVFNSYTEASQKRNSFLISE